MENEDTTEKLGSSKAVIAYLAEHFPLCFTTTGDAKPLKIGIFDDLAKRLEGDPKVSKTRLRSALRQYTNSWRYLRAVKAGVNRVDLDGAEAGTVEEEHAQHAQETLAESKARAVEQRKAAGTDQKARSGDRQSEARKARSKPPARKAASKPKPKAKAEPKLESVDLDTIAVGQKVQVKVGQSPMPGTVSAIEKSEVQVQLMSGITVKVKIENVFITS